HVSPSSVLASLTHAPLPGVKLAVSLSRPYPHPTAIRAPTSHPTARASAQRLPTARTALYIRLASGPWCRTRHLARLRSLSFILFRFLVSPPPLPQCASRGLRSTVFSNQSAGGGDSRVGFLAVARSRYGSA
uniref:Uncharacterized protein n=1 Tax=Aegilops tauschii subsp. strangulata TaxID=200361 RepID=A0A452ZXZ5_AEGTS